jgi:hypothetical protein
MWRARERIWRTAQTSAKPHTVSKPTRCENELGGLMTTLRGFLEGEYCADNSSLLIVIPDDKVDADEWQVRVVSQVFYVGDTERFFSLGTLESLSRDCTWGESVESVLKDEKYKGRSINPKAVKSLCDMFHDEDENLSKDFCLWIEELAEEREEQEKEWFVDTFIGERLPVMVEAWKESLELWERQNKILAEQRGY